VEFELAQAVARVTFVPDQRAVEEFTAAGPHPPFHDRIHPGRLNRSTDYPGASGTKDLIERGGEAGVPVMQNELHPRPHILQVHEQVPGLLDHPRRDRVPGGSEDAYPAGAVLYDGKDVDLRSVEQARR